MHVVLVEPGDFHTGFADNRKLVRAATPDSMYRRQFDRTLGVFIADEQRGPPPMDVARVVHHALEVARPRLRHVVGMPLQRSSIALKKLLPWRLFAWVFRKTYEIEG